LTCLSLDIQRLNSDREQAAWVLAILEANRRLAQEAG
jgi:hypothetical protein